jgi:predicted RNA-binding Zn-ribbon protein involved in translation (DUF1610 family)
MGRILDASCDCGYRADNLWVGGGMLNYEHYSGYPAICESCSFFAVLKEKVEKHICSQCGGSMVFFDDPSLRRLKDGFYSSEICEARARL